MLGTSLSLLGNLIPLSFMPQILQTRDVSQVNLPLTFVSLFNQFIWLLYAIIKQDLFMIMSQGLGFSSNAIQLGFYYWAQGKLNAVDTPLYWKLFKPIISFFKLFSV